MKHTIRGLAESQPCPFHTAPHPRTRELRKSISSSPCAFPLVTPGHVHISLQQVTSLLGTLILKTFHLPNLLYRCTLCRYTITEQWDSFTKLDMKNVFINFLQEYIHKKCGILLDWKKNCIVRKLLSLCKYAYKDTHCCEH